jgi:hypothetical protein
VWVVRAGEDGHLVDEFVDGGYIALEYPDVPDGRGVDRYDVTERLRMKGWTSPEVRAELFAQFVHQMRPGHLVVLPDTARRDVVIGRVEGDYEFVGHLSADDHRHRREVVWLGRHGVDALPEAVRDLTRQRAVLAERSALLAHAEAVERGELGRDATDTERPVTPRAPRAPRAPSVRAPRAPKVVKPPKAEPPAGKRCSECFLLKPPALFPDGGDVCADCC